MSNEEQIPHDPFTETDYEEEIKKANDRVEVGCRKVLESVKKQIHSLMEPNHVNHICIEMHIDDDGKWRCTFKTQTDLKKIVDCIQRGEPQGFN